MIKIDYDPPENQLKQFAFIAVIGLPLIAFAVLKFMGRGWGEALTHEAVYTVFGLGALQLGVYMAGFKWLTWLIFVVLMTIAIPIGFVLSHVLMAAIFYLLITPIGLFFRLVGRDVMGRKPDPTARSYWHDRGPPRSPASYFKLY